MINDTSGKENDIERISCSSTKSEKSLPTHIVGLDDLLRGGFLLPQSSGRDGLVVLLKGAPGTGKTTMAMQLAIGANRWTQSELNRATIAPFGRNVPEKARIYTQEQRKGELSQIITQRLKLTVPVSALRKGDAVEGGDITRSVGSEEKNVVREFDKAAENEHWQEDIVSRLYDTYSLDDFRENTLMPLSPSGYWWVDRVMANLDEIGTERKSKAAVRKDTQDWKIRMVVLDGLNLMSTKERKVTEIEQLVEKLRSRALVSVLVYEGDQDDSGHMDYLVDMIVELDAKEIEGPPKYFLQRMCIQKSRFQQSVLGWHQYKIRDLTGINVFPSIHFHVHRLGLLNERIEDSMASLFHMAKTAKIAARKNPPGDATRSDGAMLREILQPLKEGSSTVVLGARRTWKTMLTLDFLRAGSKIGENVLLVSLMDNQDTIRAEPKQLCGWRCLEGKRRAAQNSCMGCYSNSYLLHFRPGCISSSEFFHHLHKRLELGKQIGRRITRLVFWDLTQLEYRFPLLANDRLFIPALMDYLKNSRDKEEAITSVFMGAANTQLSKAASAIADNVVFCWWDKYQGLLEGEPLDMPGGTKVRSGFAFHVDRLEGRPESGSLFFLPEKKRDRERLPHLIGTVADGGKGSKKIDANIKLFTYAKPMREHIWAMQGLDVFTKDE